MPGAQRAEGAPEDAGALLTLDVGNAVTSLVLWPRPGASEGEPVGAWRLSTDPRRTADELDVLLRHLLPASAAADAIMACVVPGLETPMADACARLLGRAPLVLGPGVRSGLRIRTEDPREVGPDRIANALAARERLGSPVLVLDLGTALTVDVVGPEGDYRGAVLAPGLDVAAAAITGRAARLTGVTLEPPRHAIGRSTAEGLRSGLVLGFLGMVEGLVEQVRAEVGDAPVLATGDGRDTADLLAERGLIADWDPLLTHRGLRLVHGRQRDGRGLPRAPKDAG